MHPAVGGTGSHRTRLAAGAAIAIAGLCLASGAAQARADSFESNGLSDANSLAVSPASAYPAGGPAMNTARAIADEYWHGDPCRGRVQISWAALGSSVNAIATWSNRTGAYADPAHNMRCSVQFNSDQAFDWPALCTVFTHEFGHLSGRQHSADPNDVMYPVYSVPLAACANTPPPPLGPGAPPSLTKLRWVPRAGVRRAVGARHVVSHRRRRRHHRRRHHTARR
jgi:Matrixin